MQEPVPVPDMATRLRRLQTLRARHHGGCMLCGRENPHGLRVDFQVLEDGSVSSMVVCGPDLEGYAGMLHGGIISTLLDGALTNCLFSYGIVAVTGELVVRIHHPVAIDVPMHLRAWLEEDMRPLYLVRAELQQSGKRAAHARAKFMVIDSTGD